MYTQHNYDNLLMQIAQLPNFLFYCTMSIVNKYYSRKGREIWKNFHHYKSKD